MKRLVILNPKSRHGKAQGAFKRIFPGLRERFGSGVQVCQTSGPGHATELVRSTLREDGDGGFRQILAAGGDGTINEVVNGYFEDGEIIRQDIPLGVINLGTGGDFFRSINELNDDYDSAIDQNCFSKVDCGEVSQGPSHDKRYFINISSIGAGGEMLDNLKRSPLQSGAVAYFVHTVRTLLRYQPKPVKIEYVDDRGEVRKMESDLINLFVCNGRFSGGGMKWAPSAELQNGLFELTLISGKRKLPLITHCPKIYAGRIAEFPGASQMRAREVTVRYRDSLSLEGDGEILPLSEDGDIKDRKICFGIRPGEFPLVL